MFIDTTSFLELTLTSLIELRSLSLSVQREFLLNSLLSLTKLVQLKLYNCDLHKHTAAEIPASICELDLSRSRYCSDMIFTLSSHLTQLRVLPVVGA